MVVLETIAGVAILFAGNMARNRTNNDDNKSEYGHGIFCICYTKGNSPREFTYIPLMSRNYSNQDELESEEADMMTIILDPEKNKHLRDKGYSGMAIIEMETGEEVFWARFLEKMI